MLCAPAALHELLLGLFQRLDVLISTRYVFPQLRQYLRLDRLIVRVQQFRAFLRLLSNFCIGFKLLINLLLSLVSLSE